MGMFSFGGRDLQLVELPSETIGARTCIFLAHFAWKGILRRKTMTRAAPREALLVTFAIGAKQLIKAVAEASSDYGRGKGINAHTSHNENSSSSLNTGAD